MRKNPCKILMLLEGPYPADARVPKETYTLINAGYQVTVIAIREEGEKKREEVKGVQVYRMPKLTIFQKSPQTNPSYIQKTINRVKSITGYIFEYLYFTSACIVLSFYISFKHGFDVIHAHNPPDTLFIIGGFYKLLGKKFIFDHHDLSPELYKTRFSDGKDLLHSLLVSFERLSCRIADIVVCTNNSYKQIEISRHGIASDKIYVVRNDPIISEFQISDNVKKIKKDDNKTALLFLGAINPQDGVDGLLEALYYLVNDLKQKKFICYIVGGGDSLEPVKQMAAKLNLTDFIVFPGFLIDRSKIMEYLYLADICVEPAPVNPLNNHSTFVKIMEYMMAAKPIVAYDLKETRYSAGDSTIFIKPGEIESFAHAVAKLIDDPKLRETLGNKGHKRILEELNWEKSSQPLLDAYRHLTP